MSTDQESKIAWHTLAACSWAFNSEQFYIQHNRRDCTFRKFTFSHLAFCTGEIPGQRSWKMSNRKRKGPWKIDELHPTPPLKPDKDVPTGTTAHGNTSKLCPEVPTDRCQAVPFQIAIACTAGKRGLALMQIGRYVLASPTSLTALTETNALLMLHPVACRRFA